MPGPPGYPRLAMSPPLLIHPLIAELVSLGLRPDDYAVFGSGPLLAHGMPVHVNDLDIVARGAAWQKVARLRTPVPAPSGSGLMVELAAGDLQVFNAWTPPDWDVDTLIEQADVIEGIRFASLADVLARKRRSPRPQDAEQGALIEHPVAN